VELTVSHRWDLTIGEARALQAQLASKVITHATFDPESVRTVAGVDVGFRDGVARAAVVVLSYPDLTPIDCAVAELEAAFPYVPGLLAFREGPAVLAAVKGLRVWPDLLLFDAQGIAHPARLGLASHLGVLFDWPSIGCAKSRLVGMGAEPPDIAGAWAPLNDGDQTIGAMVRSRRGCKPLYVSIGHRIDLATAIDWVQRCTRGHRLPETTRLAHRAAGGARIGIGSTVRGVAGQDETRAPRPGKSGTVRAHDAS